MNLVSRHSSPAQCLFLSELKKKMAFTEKEEIDKFLSNWTEEMQEHAKYIARRVLSTFWGIFARKKICLRVGKFVKNLEIFWMNNKTIIEFGFLMSWSIM